MCDSFSKSRCYVCNKKWSLENNIKLYNFPKILDSCPKLEKMSKLRQKKWRAAIKGAAIPYKILIKYCVVCSDHFLSGKSSNILDINNVDWVPSLHLKSNNIISKNNRTRRSETFNPDLLAAMEMDMELSDYRNIGSDNKSVQEPSEIRNFGTQTIPFNSHKLVQTDITCVDEAKLIASNQCLQNNVEELQSEIRRNNKANSENSLFGRETLKNNNKKSLNFTGLKFKTLKVIYEQLEQYLEDGTNIGKSKFELLVLTLMRLRVDFSFTTIAFLFRISNESARKYFQLNLHVLYKKLQSLIIWPSKQQLLYSSPESFKFFFKNGITIILDCFEISIEKPNNELTARQCWSNYKSSHTIKYLIGISPNGCITFISPGYGGRSSDKFVTENSGFLEKLSKDDFVMADRGFLIRESITKVNAKLVVPAFTKNKNQLSPIEIEETRKIANVRIHVERVIGMLRNKFHFLSKRKFPVTSVCHSETDVAEIDKIVTVCAALINLSPPIVLN